MTTIKKISIGLFLFSISIINANGQKNVGDFLDLGRENASMFTHAYLKPYGEMLGKTLNGGWYNSADVHKVAGFNFTVGVNMAMVPGSAKSFDVGPLVENMEGAYTLKDPNVYMTPSVAGAMEVRPTIQFNGTDVLTMPNGSGFDKFPMPMIQLGVGLPFHTEIGARFIPGFKASDAGKVSLLGFMVKHSIKEYVPFISRVPFLSSSVMFGYTNFASTVAVPYEPQEMGQELKISSNAYTTRFLLGVNVPFVAVYTGLGYGWTNSDFGLKGVYKVDWDEVPEPKEVENPFSVAYKTSGFDANAGVRFRLGIIALHGEYTIGDYQMVTVGLGISFR